MKRQEVWKVRIRSHTFAGEDNTYLVFATTAAIAERRGLAIAKEEEIKSPYCASAIFEGYVYFEKHGDAHERTP